MTRNEQIEVLRGAGIGLHRHDAVALVRVSGPDAHDAVDAVSPRPVFLRDGQMLHTTLLDDAGCCAVDLYIIADDLDFLLVAEGTTGEALVRRLRADVPGSLEVEIVDLDASHAIVAAHGPYAWELMSDLLGPEVTGVPYLTTFQVPEWDGLALRAGKTGEYGYEILVPATRADDVYTALLDAGQRYAASPVGTAAVDLCALENGFWCVRHRGATEHGPAALQLQWRVDWSRDVRGLRAAAAERGGPRLTWFRADRPVAPGDPIRIDREAVGNVLHADVSPVLGPIGTALIARHRAHAGLELQVEAGDGPVPGTTVAAPMLRNRSLFLDAQRHAWASRHLDDFPALVP